MKQIRLDIRVSAETYAEIQALSESQRRERSDMVRLLLIDGLKHWRDNNGTVETVVDKPVAKGKRLGGRK